MAASERYDEGRPRRNSVRVRLTRYFQSKGVGVEAAAALAVEAARCTGTPARSYRSSVTL